MRHQVEEGQAKLSKLASPAAGGVKKSSMARELWRSRLSGTGERWSISIRDY